MDEKRFDALTKALSEGRGSRRAALRLLAGSALGGALARLGLEDAAAEERRSGDCRKPGKECATGNQCCSKKCKGRKCRCDDGRKPCGGKCCETGQACVDNQCSGGTTCQSPSECPQPPNPCKRATCGANGQCGVEDKPNGEGCDDGDKCTTNDTCQNGTCIAGQTKNCAAQGDECNNGVCNLQTGECEAKPKQNGATCDDNDPCTRNDACLNGRCVGDPIGGCQACENAGTCPQPPNQCKQATCSDGVCGVEDKDGGSCQSSNPCVKDAACRAGQCSGNLDATCTRCDNDPDACTGIQVDQCQEAVCADQGICEVRDKDGGSCDAGNPCVANATCQAGRCGGALRENCVRCDNNPNVCGDVPVKACERAVCGPRGFCVTEFRPSTFVCREAAGPCDVAETCTGTSAQCPPDLLAPPTQICRPAAGPCDVPEVCTGASPQCPPDQFRPSSFVCRAASDPCDAAEFCTGTSATCPADRKVTCPADRTCCTAGSTTCVPGSCCVVVGTSGCTATTPCCSGIGNCNPSGKCR